MDISVRRLWPQPATGKWKLSPEDFYVEELWEPVNPGQGEHVLLHLEKIGQNSDWVARQIARFAGVRDFDVGLHGLKDRHAVTRQWMSVYLGKRPEPDWDKLQIEGTQLLQVSRTTKKIRRGEHRGNRFRIIVRDVQGDRARIDEQLNEIAANGFPNYFGPQRFGHDGYNLGQAGRWFRGEGKPKKKAQRGLFLSAARSHLFNRVLDIRMEQGTWNCLIEGDFPVTKVTSNPLVEDKVPSGPMLGGAEFLEGLAGDIEQQAVSDFADWLTGLHAEGVRTDRRAMVAEADNLAWSWDDDSLELSFDLGSGCFASVLLDQCFELN
ncbi:tRNA pseudouridine(13) synthase TruD [Hahella ganghwensis]|uniref:tRNA pseudouridine(13) synthase TruD n=1 Tax=Hahella ganghwensis TaxID=286420 RepID=UPI000368D02F|nr:tRNA pseudouridine(13) synthase TruD [Hahella ganghwensis]